jgi:uncharacterized protein YsxB (DUF464 family)
MIDVTLKTKNDNVVGFRITGHANFDEEGSDIVCSAVTILAYSAINTLDLYADDIEFEDKDEIMELKSNEYNENIDVIFTYFETGIQTLLFNYHDYIKLHYEEV